MNVNSNANDNDDRDVDNVNAEPTNSIRVRPSQSRNSLASDDSPSETGDEGRRRRRDSRPSNSASRYRVSMVKLASLEPDGVSSSDAASEEFGDEADEPSDDELLQGDADKVEDNDSEESDDDPARMYEHNYAMRLFLKQRRKQRLANRSLPVARASISAASAPRWAASSRKETAGTSVGKRIRTELVAGGTNEVMSQVCVTPTSRSAPKRKVMMLAYLCLTLVLNFSLLIFISI